MIVTANAAHATALVPVAHRRDGWTPERQRTFLATLAETGCVSAACAAVDAEVKRLRGLGLDWADIGAALGVSRQGARQRYARFDAPESP